MYHVYDILFTVKFVVSQHRRQFIGLLGRVLIVLNSHAHMASLGARAQGLGTTWMTSNVVTPACATARPVNVSASTDTQAHLATAQHAPTIALVTASAGPMRYACDAVLWLWLWQWFVRC